MEVTQNIKAFLDTVATSELTAALLAVSDNGYNVIVGSTADDPDLFSSYADHPRKLVFLSNLNIKSTAAGRYQILARYYDVYKINLSLPDFGPDSQDKIAIQMMHECGALDALNNGDFNRAIFKASSRWASLPGNDYEQHQNKLADLINIYKSAGGILT